MALTNAQRFNTEVLRAIAILYENHPRQMSLDFNDLSGVPEDGSWQADQEAYTYGTMQWLVSEGLVRGRINDNVCVLEFAQLTGNTWRKLQQTDPNTSAQPLGLAVLQGAEAPEHEKTKMADLLMGRLLGS